MKLLLLDIGNTFTKWLVTEACKPLSVLNRGEFPSSGETFEKKLSELARKYPTARVFVSSVKPSSEGTIKNLFPSAETVSAEKLRGLIPVDYETPETLGADRVLNALGGLRYADTFAVVSFGTATVVDLVVEKVFKGGAVFLGVEKHLECLSKSAEKLPRLKLPSKPHFLGESTEKALLSGVFYSTLFAVRGFLEEYRKRFGVKRVFLTGGAMDLFADELKGFEPEEKPLLLFEGLKTYADNSLRCSSREEKSS